ncbi:hypothetical protein [Streptomyces profundus]|uniref:hypothetical protein n=1 Tax=Streptomyces profundus TaxID=2867410 RepID=UPI001D167805|nr:hypothetical protein [Streptomyces sp. MA3_2.13]UED85540.1 hypothetical protein K4G22_16180 [Streptomyces sp. MA3_2.13]
MTIPIHRLDLRGGHALAVAAVAEARQRETDRFLVLDSFAELPSHERLYEDLLAHDAVPTLCVAVGAPDDTGEPADEPPPAGRLAPALLRRPMPLRPPSAGVVWVPDPTCGDSHIAMGDALRPLIDLLAEPEVFDAVLDALAQIAEGVAVLALDVLEQSLSVAARGRVWREAVERLVGQETPVAAFVTGALGDAPAPLAPLVGQEVPGSLAGHPWLVGELRDRHEACGAALTAAQDSFDVVRHPLAPFTGAVRQVDLPTRIWELVDTLDAYQRSAVEALRRGDTDEARADQRERLFHLGINLPDSAEGSREPVGPALRSYTEGHLRRGVSLRSAAARLAALAQRAYPTGSAARIPDLDEACPAEERGELRRPQPFPLGSPNPRVNAAESGAVALLAGLWPGAGWLLGPAMGLACAGLAAFLVRRRPNRDTDGGTDGGVVGTEGRLAGGLAGGLAGALLGQLLGPPALLAGLTLLLSIAGLVFLGQRWWTRAVEDWWEATAAERAGGWRRAIADVLTEAAIRDWFLHDAREYCAATADSVGRTLRTMADTAERHAMADTRRTDRHEDRDQGEPPDPGWAADADDWATDPGGHGGWDAEDGHTAGDRGDVGAQDGGPGSSDWDSWDRLDDDWTVQGQGTDPAPEPVGGEAPVPRWLRRETGDGGKALVETLAGDLTAGTVHVLGGLWGALEAAPDDFDTGAVHQRMTALLNEETQRLADDPAPPPAFLPNSGQRPGPAALFGLNDESARAMVAARAETEGRPLSTRAHRNALSRDPTAARRVCFAPASVRRDDRGWPAGWDTAGEDVVWTRSGRFTGVVRLLPLRRGAVGTPRGESEGPTW